MLDIFVMKLEIFILSFLVLTLFMRSRGDGPDSGHPLIYEDQ